MRKVSIYHSTEFPWTFFCYRHFILSIFKWGNKLFSKWLTSAIIVEEIMEENVQIWNWNHFI